jgi:tRNA G10  N-methylase Trm11
MQYFFILGANPTLSLAELATVFGMTGNLSLAQSNVAILETEQTLAADIIKKIGGTIKFGLIYGVVNRRAIPELPRQFMAKFVQPQASAGKFFFGVSYYGQSKINIKALAMEFKKLLKQTGINSRWVACRGELPFATTLSSVIVEQNKLTSDRGVEIVIIQSNNKLLISKTLAVQPFKELSFRDYGRPARDDRSGLLPPKLAQIMLNLAVSPPCKGRLAGLGGLNSLSEKSKESIKNTTILDPFCGSGTLLTEALLMGYSNLIGADISRKAIINTQANLNWLKSQFPVSNFRFHLLNIDASQLSKHLAPDSVDAIITEPYLGPPRGKFDMDKIVKELEQLYSRSLTEFKKILKPDGRIVMVWPVFSGKQRNVLLNPDLSDFKIINPLPKNLRTNIFIKLTNRDTIIYGRKNQKVWREIVVLEK